MGESALGRVGSYPSVVLGKPLSPRERDVMYLVALGWTAEQIGERLCIQTTTAKQHKHNSFVKLGVFSGSIEAVVKLLITDLVFYEKVKKAVLTEEDKPEDYNRGGLQPGGFC